MIHNEFVSHAATTTGPHVSNYALAQFILYELTKENDLSNMHDHILNLTKIIISLLSPFEALIFHTCK